MKKKLLTLIAVFGLALSSWGMTPDATDAVTAGPQPQAQAGYGLVRGMWGYMGWRTDTIWYGMTSTFYTGFYGGLGASAGFIMGGPVGSAIGAGLAGA